MSDTGGAYAISGFLYQLLCNLDWAAKALFPVHGNSDDATMIIEPRGGDVLYTGKRHVRVDQIKTKSNRKWTTNEIVKSVLPDLYKAVDNKYGDEVGEYGFSTNQEYAKIGEFRSFLIRVSQLDSDGNKWESLDDTKVHKIRDYYSESDRAFFGWICAVINDSLDKSLTTKPTTNRSVKVSVNPDKVWILLSRLKLNDPLTIETIDKHIDQVLLSIVDRAEDVGNVKSSLLGILLRAASNPETKIKVNDLLKSARINPARAQAIINFSANIWSNSRIKLQRLGYDSNSEGDVPKADSNGIAIAGSFDFSEGAKRVAAVASHMIKEGKIVIVVEETVGANDLKMRIAEQILARHLLLEGVYSFASLKRILARMVGSHKHLEIFVCVLSVRGRNAFRDIKHKNWNDDGVTVVMSSSPAYTASDVTKAVRSLASCIVVAITASLLMGSGIISTAAQALQIEAERMGEVTYMSIFITGICGFLLVFSSAIISVLPSTVKIAFEGSIKSDVGAPTSGWWIYLWHIPGYIFLLFALLSMGLSYTVNEQIALIVVFLPPSLASAVSLYCSCHLSRQSTSDVRDMLVKWYSAATNPMYIYATDLIWGLFWFFLILVFIESYLGESILENSALTLVILASVMTASHLILHMFIRTPLRIVFTGLALVFFFMYLNGFAKSAIGAARVAGILQIKPIQVTAQIPGEGVKTLSGCKIIETTASVVMVVNDDTSACDKKFVNGPIVYVRQDWRR